MNLKTVKRELAAIVKANVGKPTTTPATPDLECFGYCPDIFPEPCFYTGETELDVNNTFGDGSDVARITCRVLVGHVEDEYAQGLLDIYLSRTGPGSIRAVLASDAARGAPGQLALNGAADDLAVERITGYRMYEHAERKYYGAEIVVRVVGS